MSELSSQGDDLTVTPPASGGGEKQSTERSRAGEYLCEGSATPTPSPPGKRLIVDCEEPATGLFFQIDIEEHERQEVIRESNRRAHGEATPSPPTVTGP